MESWSGNAPITADAIAQPEMKAEIKIVALETAGRPRLSTRCIDQVVYSSLGRDLSGTISSGFRTSSETSSLIAPHPLLYMCTPGANIFPVMLRASGGGPALP